MKTIADFEAILQDVKFNDWEFSVGFGRGRIYLQLHFDALCSKDGVMKRWSSRKWELSPYMTRSEVVATAFKAVTTAIEHETRETFKYKGRAVFGPHIDVEALFSVANTEDVRGEAVGTDSSSSG